MNRNTARVVLTVLLLSSGATDVISEDLQSVKRANAPTSWQGALFCRLKSFNFVCSDKILDDLTKLLTNYAIILDRLKIDVDESRSSGAAGHEFSVSNVPLLLAIQWVSEVHGYSLALNDEGIFIILGATNRSLWFDLTPELVAAVNNTESIISDASTDRLIEAISTISVLSLDEHDPILGKVKLSGSVDDLAQLNERLLSIAREVKKADFAERIGRSSPRDTRPMPKR